MNVSSNRGAVISNDQIFTTVQPALKVGEYNWLDLRESNLLIFVIIAKDGAEVFRVHREDVLMYTKPLIFLSNKDVDYLTSSCHPLTSQHFLCQ